MAEEAPLMIAPLDPTSPASLQQAVDLVDAELGAGLYSMEDLRATAADPTAIVLGAWQAGRLVAIAVGVIQVPADEDYYANFGADAQRLFAAGRVGSLSALAVAPTARRRGLAAELVKQRLEFFRAQGCVNAIAIAWMPADFPSGYSAPLFRKLGFSEGNRADDFYAEESVRDGWSCPADGIPCRCAAVLFWLPLLPNI